MTAPTTHAHPDGAHGSSHLRALGRLNGAGAVKPPCVLDGARPQAHGATEAII